MASEALFVYKFFQWNIAFSETHVESSATGRKVTLRLKGEYTHLNIHVQHVYVVPRMLLIRLNVPSQVVHIQVDYMLLITNNF